MQRPIPVITPRPAHEHMRKLLLNSVRTAAVAVVPVRGKPESGAEVVTEYLPGEPFTVTSTAANDFILTQGHLDGYQGWIDWRQSVAVNGGHASHPQAPTTDLAFSGKFPADLIGTCHVALTLTSMTWIGLRPMFISRGALLPQIRDGHFVLGEESCTYTGETIALGSSVGLDRLPSLIEDYAPVPYRWGGKSAWGLDCSGFTQIIMRCLGVNLPRDASQQISCGQKVTALSNARLGDLFFGRNVDTGSPHVGILLGNGKVAHCSAYVRTDEVSDKGLFDLGERRIRYRLAWIPTPRKRTNNHLGC